ncbi:MAG: ABC transporter permease [Puniceicoccales bacterium]|jgi:putative ABC transport system permease protein|nr:ABC transporter permease [Puniceicoccales bacterium]
MIFLNAFLIALREIRRNLTRAILTMLGIIIGVAAVITMQTLGQGTTAAVKEQFSRFGSNLLFMRPGVGFGPRVAGVPNFTEADVEAISHQIPGVAVAIPVRSSALTTRFRQNARSTSVTGTTRDYFDINNWRLENGRFFTETEQRGGAAVCVIGQTVRRELFDGTGAEPLGEQIIVGGVPCEIIGILATRGQMGMRDQDDTIVTPLRTVRSRIVGRAAEQDIDNINISATSEADSGVLVSELTSLMRQRRNIAPGQDNNFSVFDSRQISEAQGASVGLMTSLLAAVAGVALLVGGIGIMNIMLVSVTERTREIGIRMAIGARAREVLLQFLVEATTLSCAGGLIGIVIAFAICFAIAPVIGVAFTFDPVINIVAFIFSALVGIIFGFMPARRAAALDPIAALHHE